MQPHQIASSVSPSPQLERSLSLHRAFLQHIPVAIAMLDDRGCFLLVSQRWLTDWDRSSSQVSGKPYDRAAPFVPQTWQQSRDRAMQGDSCTGTEIWIQQEGTTVEVQWQVCPWYLESGAIGGLLVQTEFLACGRETDSTVTQTEALTASGTPPHALQNIREEQFRAIAQASPMPLMVSRFTEGNVLYANDRAMDIFGVSPEAVPHCRAPDFYADPGDRQQLLAALLREEHIQAFKVQVRRTNGTLFWAAVSARLIEYNGERAILTTFYDLTERQQTEAKLQELNQELDKEVQKRTAKLKHMVEQLQAEIRYREQVEAAKLESEAEMRSLLTALPYAIFVLDSEGCHLKIAPTDPAILYKPAAELLDKTIEEVLPPEPAKLCREALHQAIATQKRVNIEYELLIRDAPMWFATSMIPLPEGRVMAIARDITHRKQSEQRIQQINQELEQRVQERTAQLEATNRELEAFCYSVSHDLRAPLRSINGFGRALLEHCGNCLDERGRHYLERIRANSQRMGELIDDLLSLSQVTRSQMRRMPVNLSHLALEIVQELREWEPEREIEAIVAPNLTACGDRRLLKVALENLLHNAWKYTSHHATARIEFGAIALPDGTPAYFVRDDGAGFDPAYTHKLFGVFQRLHLESEFPGTGVGLATVQRIIHRHGGQVWAEGAVERGATFYFTLCDARGGHTIDL